MKGSKWLNCNGSNSSINSRTWGFTHHHTHALLLCACVQWAQNYKLSKTEQANVLSIVESLSTGFIQIAMSTCCGVSLVCSLLTLKPADMILMPGLHFLQLRRRTCFCCVPVAHTASMSAAVQQQSCYCQHKFLHRFTAIHVCVCVRERSTAHYLKFFIWTFNLTTAFLRFLLWLYLSYYILIPLNTSTIHYNNLRWRRSSTYSI